MAEAHSFFVRFYPNSISLFLSILKPQQKPARTLCLVLHKIRRFSPPSILLFLTRTRSRRPRHRNLRFCNPFFVYRRATARDGDEASERDVGAKLLRGIDDNDDDKAKRQQLALLHSSVAGEDGDIGVGSRSRCRVCEDVK